MPFFDSDGLEIHYIDEGAGAPVVLIHGFGLSAAEHWVRTGVVERLKRRWRVIAIDVRGHGESAKPHDSAQYGLAKARADVLRLLDHLNITRARILGYSMGSRIALELLMRDPERMNAVVLGGFGQGGQIAVPGQRHRIAAALLAEDPGVIEDVLARRFRRGAERSGKDLRALAAYIAAEETTDSTATIDFAALKRVRSPVLVVAAENDSICGDPRPLTQWFHDVRVIVIDGSDHASLAGDERFQQAVEEFLASVAD
jgi:pimeloyl-ACP methyl ester carboxylesterase